MVGNTGTIEIQTGGSLTIEGSDSQAVTFADATGELTLDDLAGFQNSDGYDMIWGFQQGNVIDLPGVVADRYTYDISSNTLTLRHDGMIVGTIAINTVDGEKNFVLTPDGTGGTRITYQQPDPLQVVPLPVAVVAAPGQSVSLGDILTSAFGGIPGDYTSYGLSYLGKAALDNDNWSYWDPSDSSASGWTDDGTLISQLPRYSGVPPLNATVTVPSSELASIDYQAGNNIGAETYLKVPIAGDGAVPTQNEYYALITIDPHVESPTASSGIVNPSDIVESALRFASYYPNPPNDSDCGFIAMAVAAAAGATMPINALSTDPDSNVSGGFWRVVYRGTDEADPVSNWSTLVQPGDVVRMGFQGGGQHTTTILAKNADGSVVVYDNADQATDADSSTIGIHDATYWDDTIPDSITIYRLDPLHQYLIAGGPQAEFIQGSTFNNLIQPGGGADTITAGNGENEIQDTKADLNGITVTDFHPGDWLDVTDLALDTAGVSYNAGSGQLTVTQNGAAVSTLDLPSGLPQLFSLAADGTGGTLVNLECFVEGTMLRVPGGEIAAEALREGDSVMTLDGTAKPIVWIGRRRIDCRRHPDSRLVYPVRILAGAFGEGLPRRDLWLSPNHAVFVEGALIPIKYLVNGSTVASVPSGEIVYYHIELARHDVLLAEGLPAESYLDVGDRGNFANGGGSVTLHPDFAALTWEAAGYAPLTVTGPRLDRARERLAARDGVKTRRTRLAAL